MNRNKQNKISLSLLLLGGMFLISGLLYDYRSVDDVQAVTIASPNSNQNLDASQPTFTGTIQPGNSVSLELDDQYLTTLRPDNQGNWSYTLPQSMQLTCSDTQHRLKATEYQDQLYQMDGSSLVSQDFNSPTSLDSSIVDTNSYQNFSQGFSYPGSNRVYLIDSTGNTADLRYINQSDQSLSAPISLGLDRVIDPAYISGNFVYASGTDYADIAPDGSVFYVFTENTASDQAELLVIDYQTANIIDQISINRGPVQANYSYNIVLSADGDYLYYYDYDQSLAQYTIRKADTTNYTAVDSYQLGSLSPSYAYYLNGKMAIAQDGSNLYISLIDNANNQSYIQSINTSGMSLINSVTIGTPSDGYITNLIYNQYSDQVDLIYKDLSNPSQTLLSKRDPGNLSQLSVTSFASYTSYLNLGGGVRSYPTKWVAYLGYDDQNPSQIPFVSFYNLDTGQMYTVQSSVFSQSDFDNDDILYTLYPSSDDQYIYLGSIEDNGSNIRLAKLEAFELGDGNSAPISIGTVSGLASNSLSFVTGIYRSNVDTITTNFSYKCPISSTAQYDLRLEKTTDKSSYKKTEEIVYQVKVTNIGNKEIGQIDISDSLPPGLVTSNSQIACSLPPGIAQSNCQINLTGNNQVSVEFRGASLEPNRYILVTIIAEIEVPAASFVNTAKVSSSVQEIDDQNNTDTASVDIADYQASSQSSNTNHSNSTNNSSNPSATDTNSSSNNQASSQSSADLQSANSNVSTETSQLNQVGSLPEAGSGGWWVFMVGIVMFVVGITMTNQLNAFLAKQCFRGIIRVFALIRLNISKINQIKIVG